MSSRPELKLDWCSHAAARYAVEHWHYSGCMPIGKLVKIGVWEDGGYIGAVLFSTGASPQIHKALGVGRFNMCELVRVALRGHVWEVSKIVAIAVRMLRRLSPGLRVIVSFADPEHGHIGGIYQGGNWVYCGKSTPGLYYRLADGSLTHNRNLQGPKGFCGKPKDGIQRQYTERLKKGLASGAISKVVTAPKYKYLYPLDTAMRAQIEPLRKPYPKRAGSIDSDAPADQAGEGGASPTPALHSKDTADA